MIELNERSTQLDHRTRMLWLAVRQGLIIVIRAIEDYLELEHSRPTKRERGEPRP